MSIDSIIRYGTDIPDESQLRLVGDLSGGKRAVELGISDCYNAPAFAALGAKSIAVDTDAARIAETRRRATDAELQVQCLETDLADLGDITSSTCSVVVAVRSLGDVDDLGRLLRQVHRILQPSMPFVISLPHPFAVVGPDHVYGATERTVGEWFTSLARTNFRVDQLLELGAGPTSAAPTTLIIRAHKEGS